MDFKFPLMRPFLVAVGLGVGLISSCGEEQAFIEVESRSDAEASLSGDERFGKIDPELFEAGEGNEGTDGSDESEGDIEDGFVEDGEGSDLGEYIHEFVNDEMVGEGSFSEDEVDEDPIDTAGAEGRLACEQALDGLVSDEAMAAAEIRQVTLKNANNQVLFEDTSEGAKVIILNIDAKNVNMSLLRLMNDQATYCINMAVKNMNNFRAVYKCGATVAFGTVKSHKDRYSYPPIEPQQCADNP